MVKKEAKIFHAARENLASLPAMLNDYNINALSHDGSSLLHFAVSKKDSELVTLLLKRRIDVNIKRRKFKETALSLAVSQSNCPLKIIQQLVLEPTTKLNLQNSVSKPISSFNC